VPCLVAVGLVVGVPGGPQDLPPDLAGWTPWPGRRDGVCDSLCLGPVHKACCVTTRGQRDGLAVHAWGNGVKAAGSLGGLLGTDGFGSNKEE